MKIIIVELLVLVTLYTDLKYHRIPNLLTFIGMLVGILINLPNNFRDSLLGFFIIFVGYIPVYIMGAVAAGDVKLLMAVGLIMGYKFTFITVLITVLCNLIVTVFVLMKKKRLGKILKYTLDEVKYRLLILVSKKRFLLEKPSIEAKIRIPYMPAIAVGINVTLLIWYGIGLAYR